MSVVSQLFHWSAVSVEKAFDVVVAVLSLKEEVSAIDGWYGGTLAGS